MTNTIPSSLKWLIAQYQSRQRMVRELDAQIESLSKEKASILEELVPLAKVIDIHEIPVVATDIPQLRSKAKNSNLPYGTVARLIYQYLGSLPLGSDASVTEIYYHCCKSLNIINEPEEYFVLLKKSVRKQLKNLAYRGKIQRTLSGNNLIDSRYSYLPTKESVK